MEPINGKVYHMWGGLVENKSKMIGGILTDLGDNVKTKIKDVVLEPCGEDSAEFRVIGKDFTCGVNVKYAGLTGAEGGGLFISVSGFAGFTIQDRSEALHEKD